MNRSAACRATAARSGPARRRRHRQGPAVLRFRRHAPLARSPPRSLERRRPGLGVLHHPRARLADRRGSARRHRADQRQRRLGPRFELLLLRPARRQSSAAAHLSPSAGHAAERRHAGLRGAGQRLVRGRRGKCVGPLLHRRHRQPGDFRTLADRPQPMPSAVPRLVAARETGVRYSVDDRGDELFIRTNDGDAIDFSSPWRRGAAPDRGNWRDWIAHRPGRYIIGFALRRPPRAARAGECAGLDRGRDLADGERARHRLRRGGLRAQRSRAATSTTPRGCASSTSRRRRRGDLRLRPGHPGAHPAQDPGDPVRPRSRALRDDAAHGAAPRRRGGADHGADAEDTPLDGCAPLLLYGYGSYGIAMPATSRSTRLSLVDRGWIWAIAHIRGGSDKGWGWFLDGKGEEAQHLHRLRRAEHLIAEGYRRPAASRPTAARPAAC